LGISQAYILFNTLTSILKPLTSRISSTPKLVGGGKVGRGGRGGKEGRGGRGGKEG